jgi:hypothetical protein
VIRDSIESVLSISKAEDGGIALGPSTSIHSDVCVNAMFLNYASYFKIKEENLTPIVDSILNEKMPDGGFNCQLNRSGAKHSSLHTTLSVLEGLVEFQKNGNQYRKSEVDSAIADAEEFILIHQLFISDRTGEIINKSFLKFPYPCRWKYDVLRALDYFQYAKRPWDERMSRAMEILLKKRKATGTLNTEAAHAGQVHFTMEKAGKPGRWNTLRALRVLQYYNV